MSQSINNQLIKTLNTVSQLLIKSFQEVQNLTSNYIKLSAEEERKQKERSKPPKVYYEKDGPFPQEQDKEARRQEEKKHNAENGKKEEKKEKAAVVKAKETNRTKPPPQYLNYRKEQECAKTSSNKLPQKVALNDTSAEKEDQNSKKVAKVQAIVPLPPKKVQPPTPVLRPKSPVSAFLRFNKAHIEHVRATCPHIIQTDLVTVTGHMWKNLDPEEKKKYEDAYARDKERYDAEMIEFFKRYPNEKKSKKQIQREKVASNNANNASK